MLLGRSDCSDNEGTLTEIEIKRGGNKRLEGRSGCVVVILC